MSIETESTFQPIYMSWATFDNITDGFRASGLPAQIDRSVLASRSGGDQAQFLRAASAFGFIDKEGAHTERFRTYVRDPEARPGIMRQILSECYPEVVALPSDATPQMLQQQFRSFGIEGDTVRKAIAFYLNAARFAKIELSPHFAQTRPGAGGRRTTRRSRKSTSEPERNGAGGGDPPPSDPFQGLHPAIVTLVQALPSLSTDGTKPEFSDDEREAWFAYATATFNLIYSKPARSANAA